MGCISKQQSGLKTSLTDVPIEWHEVQLEQYTLGVSTGSSPVQHLC